MALLDLMHDSLFGTTSQSQRKMFFSVHVLYIDEGQAVYGWDEEKWTAEINLIKSVCDSYKFSYTIVPIESIFDIDSDLLDMRRPTEEEQKLLDDEKKKDFDNHTLLPEIFENEARNRVMEVEELAMKR